MPRTLVLIAVLVCAAPPASATTWSFGCPPSCSQSDGAGIMRSSSIRFDDEALHLEWDATFSPNGEGITPNGFWAVFTDGPGPREVEGGLAILYGDGQSGSVWAYRYDPELGRATWRDPARFLVRFADAVSFDAVGELVSMQLRLDVSSINSPDPDAGAGTNWVGIDFGPGFGVSSQFFSQPPGSGNARAAGEILGLELGVHTSYGRHQRVAQPMPEPGAMLAFAVGLAVVGFGVVRGRRSA